MLKVKKKLNIKISEERKKITQEVLLLKKLNHNNIIKYINAWINEEKKEFVFITEILNGGNLKT